MDLSKAFDVDNKGGWNQEFEFKRLSNQTPDEFSRGMALGPEYDSHSHGSQGEEDFGFKKLFKKIKKKIKHTGNTINKKAIRPVTKKVLKPVVNKAIVPLAKVTAKETKFYGGKLIQMGRLTADNMTNMQTTLNKATIGLGSSAEGLGNFMTHGSSWILVLVGGGGLAVILVPLFLK